MAYPLLLVTYSYTDMTLEIIHGILFATATVVPSLVGLAFGMLMFHFLKSDNGVSFHMSLPTTRFQLFFSQMLSGLLLYILPLLVTTIAVAIVAPIRIVGDSAGLPLVIFQWVLTMLLIFLVNFSISIAIGMVTGSSIWQIIFIIIYYLLPLYFEMATNFFGEKLLRGYTSNNGLHQFFRSIDLGGRMVQYSNWQEAEGIWNQLIFLAIYFLIAVLAAFLLYRFKKMESNREWVGFGFMKAIFISVVTLCTVILMSVFFDSVLYRDGKFGLYIGVVCGSMLGYIVAAMIAWKTIYLKKAWMGVFASLAICLAITGIVDADVFGYERYLPKEEEIAGVTIPSGNYKINEMPLGQLIVPRYTGRYKAEFYDPQNIRRIRQIHQNIIDQSGAKRGNDSLRIIYRLKSGKEVGRWYSDASYQTSDIFTDLTMSEESLKQSYIMLDEEKAKALIAIKISGELEAIEETFTGQKMESLLQVLREEVHKAAEQPEEMEIRENDGTRIFGRSER